MEAASLSPQDFNKLFGQFLMMFGASILQNQGIAPLFQMNAATASVELPKVEDKLMTVAEVASKLRCTEKTVRNYIRAGQLKAVASNNRSGSKQYFKVKVCDFENYISSNTR